MHFITIANTRIPTEKAHGYQISKVCEELAMLGVKTELWLPSRRATTEESVFEFYGLEKNFSVRKLGFGDAFRFEKYLGRATFFLQSLIFFAALVFTRVPKDSVIYTRNPEIAWLFSLRGRKVFYNAHSFPSSKHGLLRFFLWRVKGIVCNSHGTEEAFREAGYKNTITLSNGVALEQFIDLPPKNELRKKFELPEQKKIVLYVGHFYTWKGVDVIFEAAEKTKDNDMILYVLVGGTPKDFAKYDALRQERGLANVLLFSYKKKTEIPAFLSCADVLLLPNVPVTEESEKYTSPIKMFEYMASGTPIVASRLPSLEEVLNDNNAVLVKAGDSEALLAGVRRILDDEIFAHMLGAQAKRDVSGRTWRAHAEALLGFVGEKE